MSESDVTTAPRLPAELLEPWWAFTADPGDGTANKLAQALDALQARDAELATLAMGVIAADLARRSVQDRCVMSLLLAFWLLDATGFLKATAAVKPARPLTEPPKRDKTAEYLDPARAKGWAPPEPLTAEPEPPARPGQFHRDRLEGLDLAAAKGRRVDIAALERRVDDANDATSLRHLEESLKLLTSIVTGGTAYSQARSLDMATTAGTTGTQQEHLVQQMGFRAAPSGKGGKDALRTLDAQNTMAAMYWRTDFRKQLSSFLAKLPTPITLGPGQILVNSPDVLRKLTIVLPPEALEGITVKPLRGETGISLLSGLKHDVEPREGEAVLDDQILNEMGASPSAYQLYELLDEGKDEPPVELWIDTHAALARLITSSRFARLQELAAGDSGQAAVCAMVERLILALTDRWGPARRDALTASAIASLTDLIDLVVVSQDAPAIALRAVDLMMDEIGLIVAIAKNYRRSDYADAMLEILLERAPSIKTRIGVGIDVSSHLVSSGMDALATALWVALSTRDHQQVTRPTEPVDYFETDLLLNKLKKGETVRPRKDVLIAALNPSTPWEAPKPAQLVQDVLNALKTRTDGAAPFALILDTTIQIGPRSDRAGQLDVVLGGLADAIGTGQLEVFLCKSFQKYATLGFGKVAAGDLTLLSMKDNLSSAPARYEVLREEIALDLIWNDEAQLVMHILRHAHRHELSLIAAAAANARFVDRFCWPLGGDQTLGTAYVEGIPLLLRSSPGNLNDAVKALPVLDKRSSFSFLRTSYVGDIDLPRGSGGATVKYVRFNTGHESRPAMAEIFYGLGHLATGLLPGEATPTTPAIDLNVLSIDNVKDHLAALASATQPPDEGTKSSPAATELHRYHNNIAASYCLCVSSLVRGQVEGRIAILTGFFNENIDGVTTDTLRVLAESLLRLAAKKNVGETPGLLTALSRAAAVLPVWQFPAEALKLDLRQAGDTEPALRLRESVKRAITLNEERSKKKTK